MMRSFTLRLLDATRTDEIEDATSFVGADASGSFGILAGHARMMTALTMGLARFRRGDRDWKYVAASGGLLYMNDDVLTLSARLYLVDDDYTRISRALQENLLVEEEQLQRIKDSLHQMEQEVLERLWEISRTARA
jgi:F-type H+-transporting ATPase subunit epsilon